MAVQQLTISLGDDLIEALTHYMSSISKSQMEEIIPDLIRQALALSFAKQLNQDQLDSDDRLLHYQFMKASEASFARLWDNEGDEVWNEYL